MRRFMRMIDANQISTHLRAFGSTLVSSKPNIMQYVISLHHMCFIDLHGVHFIFCLFGFIYFFIFAWQNILLLQLKNIFKNFQYAISQFHQKRYDVKVAISPYIIKDSIKLKNALRTIQHSWYCNGNTSHLAKNTWCSHQSRLHKEMHQRELLLYYMPQFQAMWLRHMMLEMFILEVKDCRYCGYRNVIS